MIVDYTRELKTKELIVVLTYVLKEIRFLIMVNVMNVANSLNLNQIEAESVSQTFADLKKSLLKAVYVMNVKFTLDLSFLKQENVHLTTAQRNIEF